jgi:hypothetical protein
MKTLLRATLPLSVALALAGAAVSGSALAAQSTGVINLELDEITDSLNCTTGDNCEVELVDKLSCDDPDQVPYEVTVTFGDAEMETEVDGTNDTGNAACFAVLDGEHITLTTQIVGIDDKVNGTGGDSEDPENNPPVQPIPGCTAAYNNPSIWQFYIPNLGSIGPSQFLFTPKSGASYTYDFSDGEFDVLVGSSGQFEVQFLGNASVELYQSGTSLNLVNTTASGSVEVTLECRDRPPQLRCTKNLSGPPLDKGAGPLTAQVTVTGQYLGASAPVRIEDNMDTEMTYTGPTTGSLGAPNEGGVGDSSVAWLTTTNPDGTVSLNFQYGVNVLGLVAGDYAGNDVTVYVGDQELADCSDEVTWEPQEVPAIGAIGAGTLGLGLAGLGLLAGFRRRL